MGKSKPQRDWAKEDSRHLIHGLVMMDQFVENGCPMIFEEAHGVKIRDIHGNEYIDALAGLLSVNIGYSRPEMAQAAMEQMSKLSYIYSCYGATSTATIDYGTALAKFLPAGLNRVFLTNSGSEANDIAYKLCRYYWTLQGKPNKHKIVSRNLAYHGLNQASGWATGLEKYHRNIGPAMPDFLKIPACYCYRCPFDKEYPGCDIDCALALADVIEKAGPDTVAAFEAETVYGASGPIVPPPEYFPKLREICDQYEVILILDEVIAGFGRTGKKFTYLHYDVTPDLMIISKGMISSYLPMSGIVIHDDIFKDMIKHEQFPVLHTTGGHPVACAVAKKNLEIMIEEKLVENSAKMGKYIKAKMDDGLAKYPHVAAIDGLGLFFGVELVKDKKTKEPFSEEKMMGLTMAMLGRGIICRTQASRLQFAPPLIVTKEHMDQIYEAMEASIAEMV